MKYTKLIEIIFIISLGIATVLAGYVYIASAIFNDSSFNGFYTNWQFPMMLAVFTHSVLYF